MLLLWFSIEFIIMHLLINGLTIKLFMCLFHNEINKYYIASLNRHFDWFLSIFTWIWNFSGLLVTNIHSFIWSVNIFVWISSNIIYVTLEPNILWFYFINIINVVIIISAVINYWKFNFARYEMKWNEIITLYNMLI